MSNYIPISILLTERAADIAIRVYHISQAKIQAYYILIVHFKENRYTAMAILKSSL